jgi:hypothetical protein
VIDAGREELGKVQRHWKRRTGEGVINMEREEAR